MRLAGIVSLVKGHAGEVDRCPAETWQLMMKVYPLDMCGMAAADNGGLFSRHVYPVQDLQDGLCNMPNDKKTPIRP